MEKRKSIPFVVKKVHLLFYTFLKILLIIMMRKFIHFKFTNFFLVFIFLMKLDTTLFLVIVCITTHTRVTYGLKGLFFSPDPS